MASYRFLAYSLTNSGGNDEPLGELPLGTVTYSHVLNDAGTLTGQVLLTDAANQPQQGDWASITAPGSTALYVERDGVLVWGGIIWGRQYTHSSKVLQINATEFWSYFKQRTITQSLTFSVVDPLAVAQGVVNWAQSVDGGDIGVQVGSETSGTFISFTVNWYENRPVSDVISTLSKADLDGTGTQVGFDFAIDVAYDSSGVPQKYLRLGYPRRGRIAGQTGLAFASGSDITDYGWSDDASQSAAQIIAVGTGSADQTPTARGVNLTAVSNGMPLLDQVQQYQNISDPTILQSIANGYVASRYLPLEIPQPVIRGSAPTQIGSWIVGDDARFIIDPDERFPAGLDSYYRIVGDSVQFVNDSQFEEITLTLNPAVS